jgi:hypothetical protein
MGGTNVDPVPEVVCGVYHNAADDRLCVCGRDTAQCGKRVCAANLAKPAGKLICFIHLAVIVGLAVAAFVIRRSWEGEDEDKDGRKLLQLVDNRL